MTSPVTLDRTAPEQDPPARATLKPFLKWAGGKRQLLPQIRRFYPADFGSYYEPFVGSGAVFFDLYNLGLLDQRSTTLFDNNPDLVGCYLMVRDRVTEVIRHLGRLAAGYERNPKQHYYRVRDEQFNPMRERNLRGQAPTSARYTPKLAAQLIYLNRTGFNGLFRLNSKGGFNVPIGRYSNPLICDRRNLRAVSDALRDTQARIAEAGFEAVLDDAQPGDFVYFDPPYAPLSRTAQFTSYTADGFATADQARLQRVIIELAQRNVWVVLSNSTAQEIADLYDHSPEAKAAGLRAHKVPARRAINSKASARGEVLEYLITNVRPQAGASR